MKEDEEKDEYTGIGQSIGSAGIGSRRRNFASRTLARGRSHTVGLIVSELSGGNPFFSEIILYFERAAVESGYEVLIGFTDTEVRPDHVAICATRMQERQVEGIAVLTFGMEQYLQNCAIDVPMVDMGNDGEIADVFTIHEGSRLAEKMRFHAPIASALEVLSPAEFTISVNLGAPHLPAFFAGRYGMDAPTV